MKRMISNVGWATMVAGLVSMAHVEAQKNKPLPPPNWPCVIVFGDATDDKIKSDGGGAYIDGKDGVQCYVNRSGGGNDGNLFVNASKSSPRSIVLEANAEVSGARAEYSTFENRQPGYFEITDIHNVTTLNELERRRLRVGVQGDAQFDLGEFWGVDGTSDDLTFGTHSASVVATGTCTWLVTWESLRNGLPQKLALREGISRNRVRTGDFRLPFTATVTVTGVKDGCGTP